MRERLDRYQRAIAALDQIKFIGGGRTRDIAEV